jgi:hypothetical protein
MELRGLVKAMCWAKVGAGWNVLVVEARGLGVWEYNHAPAPKAQSVMQLAIRYLWCIYHISNVSSNPESLWP